MIVYRWEERTRNTAGWLDELRAAAESLHRAGRNAAHERIAGLLIEYGELESAIADALCPDTDRWEPPLGLLREAGVLLGHAFRLSWKRSAGAAGGDPVSRFSEALSRLSALRLPDSVCSSVPEGYAYYSLYPETYLEAAGQFFEEEHPQSAVVIGIRSIGTSLSAVVAAEIEARGCEVESISVRPRGHPFARQLAVSPVMERCLGELAGRFFLIVDEGPGLSGSSLASVAAKLSALGVPDRHIVLLPSWTPEPETLLSGEARDRWRRHRKYVGSFERIRPDLCRLEELSAGKWRPLFYEGTEAPAVQPQHERRKYLDRSRGVLFKFSGLGAYGERKLLRARELSEAGFTPPAVGLENGFLITEFVEGRPLGPGAAEAGLLDRMARYLAFLKRRFETARPADTAELRALIRTNVEEGLGPEWAQRAAAIQGPPERAPAIALDGRMFPHEWLGTTTGYVKTDALDHHDDHFFPGRQDIAWDVAGTLVEFRLGPQARAYFVERYEAWSGDAGVRRRLEFYSVAYLAFRLGYARTAAGALTGSPDGSRFLALAEDYAERLRSCLGRA